MLITGLVISPLWTFTFGTLLFDSAPVSSREANPR